MHRLLLAAAVSATLVAGCASEAPSKEHSSYDQFKSIAPSGQLLTNQELSLVNQATYNHIAKLSLTPLERFQFNAYLAQAQKQYADISEAVNGTPQGSFAPVTISVVRLFDPSANIPKLQSRPYDQQTLAIADFVSDALEERLENEKSRIRPYNVQIGPQKWFSREGYYGITFGSVQPWYLEKCDQFRCPAPNLEGADLLTAAQDVKAYMAQADEAKVRAVHYWADEGDWSKIADEYMERNQIPLSKRLEVRTVLISAMNDALAATFDSKYTYWIKRPSQVDKSIHPLIPTPNHPSYPSGHSTVSKTAAVVLSHYFPENKHNWDALAQESGHSRIWGGIHFPMDHDAGVALGEKVGQAAIQKIK